MSKKIAKLSYHSPSIAQDFTQSLRDTGFVILQDSPIDNDLVNKVYDLWKVFFQSEERHLYPFDIETADGYVSSKLSETAKGHTVKDIKAFYHLIKNGRCPKSTYQESYQLFDQLAPLASQALDWIYQGLPEAVQSSLSEPLPDMIKASKNIKLRLIHYPPLTGSEPAGAVRAAEHADINLITFLPSATAKGLQVMTTEGVWIDVECTPGDLIINAGDMLQMCTNGFIKSTLHRVANPAPDEPNIARMSMPFFVHPRDEVVLSKGITALDYRMERYRENGLVVAD